MANYKVENFPKCLCSTEKCRGEIKGFQNLPEDTKKEYKGFYAPYLEKMAEGVNWNNDDFKNIFM